MHVKTAIFGAALFGSLAGAVLAGSQSRADDAAGFASGRAMQLAMIECAGGYHLDAGGNCQPENGYVDSRCPSGFIATPYPNGQSYRCARIPPGYAMNYSG